MKHLLQPSEDELCEHYPNRAERTADMIVHAVAIGAAAVGGLFLVVMALLRGGVSLASSTLIYAICLMAMLVASNIYNLRRPCPERRILRRLDEAAIFLLIAGSYTPFTTQRFEHPWDIAMTALVWSVAAGGVIGKLFFPRVPEWAWTLLYVAFGWLAVLMLKPLLMGVSAVALALLATGGLLYTLGVPLFLWRRLPFRRAIWHGFVVAGAAAHYVAVLTGVVLVGAAT
ncbi:MAG: hemolysin III family protein [Caulobacteraceae bacterium]|nr:hemolysin III family protein [Caulobacteraceae bacterium]